MLNLLLNLFKAPRVFLTLPVLAYFGNALYAIGPRGGWLEENSPAIVAVSLIFFVIAHGTRRYGRAGMIWFLVIVISITWAVETLGLLTGFPFGNYQYSDEMAPFLGHVPVFVLSAYAIMGYLSWSLATILMGQRESGLDAKAVFIVPILGAVCMVMWDLSMDPLRATIEGRWIWPDGGAHFGVPLSNYLGWFGVTWLMFQAFALYLRKHPRARPQQLPLGAYFWISIPMAYSNFVIEYLLNPFFQTGIGHVTLVNGAFVPTEDVYMGIAVLCLFTLVPLALLANFAALRQEKRPPHAKTPVLQRSENRGGRR